MVVRDSLLVLASFCELAKIEIAGRKINGEI